MHLPGGRTKAVGRDTWRHMWLPHRVEGPCWKGVPARALDPTWQPHMPPCISANSSSPSSQGMHLSFTPFGLLRYRTSSTNWYRADRRATFSLPPAPQEVPLFGGIRQYVVPMPEPGARRQGPKAFLPPWERLSLRPGLDALPEPVALGQAQRPRQHPCRQPQGAR